MADAISYISRGTKAQEVPDNSSEMSETFDHKEPVVSYEEIYGMDEQQAKGEPVRGRRYMLFTFVAMLILTIIVGMNANIQSLEKIKNERLKEATSGLERKTAPAATTTTTTPTTPATNPGTTTPEIVKKVEEVVNKTTPVAPTE